MHLISGCRSISKRKKKAKPASWQIIFKDTTKIFISTYTGKVRQMKGNIIFWLISLSLLLHSTWELVQVKWVDNLQGKPWYIIVRNCSVGITLDTLYSLGIYYLFALFTYNEEWVLQAGVKEYVLIFIISILVAYAYEWMGWKFKLWSFSENVPHLPGYFGKVALLPLLQLPLLVSLSFFLTHLILS